MANIFHYYSPVIICFEQYSLPTTILGVNYRAMCNQFVFGRLKVPAKVIEVSSGFPQSLQANSRKGPLIKL